MSIQRAVLVPINAEAAQEFAGCYLIDQVGSLFEPGTPRLLENGLWVVPIILSNSRRGPLGEAGTIAVDANTGRVLCSEEDHAEVKRRARRGV